MKELPRISHQENPPMDDCLLVMCATGTRENAEAIAGALVERREAACVQLFPIDSYYRWNGAVQHDSEVMLHIKTTRARLAEVKATIARLHGYDLPEVAALPIVDGTPAYFDWIRMSVAPDPA